MTMATPSMMVRRPLRCRIKTLPDVSSLSGRSSRRCCHPSGSDTSSRRTIWLVLLPARAATDRHATILEQMVLTEMMHRGLYAAHLRRMRVLYRERQQALISAVRDVFGDALATWPNAAVCISCCHCAQALIIRPPRDLFGNAASSRARCPSTTPARTRKRGCCWASRPSTPTLFRRLPRSCPLRSALA